MPWKIVKSGKKWNVVKEADGKVVGTHPSHAHAVSQLRALYANTSDEDLNKSINDKLKK